MSEAPSSAAAAVRRRAALPGRRADLHPAGRRAAAPGHHAARRWSSLILLDRDASNIPLAAACAVPLGPALSAALYALRRRRRDLTDLHPDRRCSGAATGSTSVGVLRIWVPLAAVADHHRGEPGQPRRRRGRRAGGRGRWWLVGVLAALWAVNALVITSLFTFRPGTSPGWPAYFLVRTPGVTLGNAGLLIVGGRHHDALLRGGARAARLACWPCSCCAPADR